MNFVTMSTQVIKDMNYGKFFTCLDVLHSHIDNVISRSDFQDLTLTSMREFGFHFYEVDGQFQMGFDGEVPDGKLRVDSDGTFVRFSFIDNPNVPIIYEHE